MINYRKYFNEGLNADDDFGMIRPGQWVNASNMRIFSTDTGATGRMEAIGGNKLLFNELPAGQNYCIGGDADDANQRLFFLNWNENGDHAIYCYYKLTSIGYIVLTDAQVEGGLNFSKYYYAHSIEFIDGNLVITDNYNEPRYVNVEAGIKLNQPSFTTSEDPYVAPVNINLIKRPPIYKLGVHKVTDASFVNNFIENNAYKVRYQYTYKDNQKSVLSTYSSLVPFNYSGDPSNAIDITVPFTEVINNEVQEISIWITHMVTNKSFLVKKFNKNNTTDAALITAHNAGATELTVRFYDNIAPLFLDDISTVTAFDNVPLLSETVTVAKNRVFLGNNLSGYDTPVITSLAVTVTDSDTTGGTFAGNWGYVTLHAHWGSIGGCQDSYMYPFVYSTTAPHKFYYFPAVRISTAWNGGVSIGDLTATQNLVDATIQVDTEISFVDNLKFLVYPSSSTCTVGYPTWQTTYEISYDYFGTAHPVDLLSFIATSSTFFKSASDYSVSIAFYDRERRKCGIVDIPVKAHVPERTYTQTSFSSTIQWTLSNDHSVDEIPDWAYYYQIHITKNLTTRFFVQVRTLGADYVVKNQDGTYAYSHSSFTYGTTYATAIDISYLPNFGLGYVYTEGDLIRVGKSDDTNYLLKVIGQDGNFVLCQPHDLGTLDTTTILLVELFTPYRPSETEPYFETGDMYSINNPGTSGRTYSILSNTISGDCYSIERHYDGTTQYITENMSPNDKTWKLWFTDTGWVNYVDDIGQVRLTQEIRFSDVNLPGTKINGLNKFQPLNVESLPQENGELNKLILANKVQEDGTVMLGICQQETSSMYLGETEVFDTQGSSYVARSAGVIGTIKSLSGSMGSYHPESVFAYNGLVWFYDQRNGGFIQYSNNGLFPVSKNGLVRASNLFSKQFASLSAAEIEALGSRPFVIGGYDPYHKEALFSIPNTGTPPKGYLVDYPSVVYPYDIYDGQGKTLIYKNEKDMWLGSMSHEWEKFIRMGNDLYAFEDGCLYIQNQDQPAYFGGVQYTAKIMYANNPGGIHTFLALGLESNKKPSFVHLRTEDPYTQSSDLLYRDFVGKEGVQYASLLRDRLTPNATGTYVQKQWAGDRLFGKSLLVMLEYSFSSFSIFDSTFDLTFQGALTDEQINTSKKLELRFSDVGNIINKGHLFNHAT